MGFNQKGKCIRGSKSRKNKPACHFVPRPSEGKTDSFLKVKLTTTLLEETEGLTVYFVK